MPIDAPTVAPTKRTRLTDSERDLLGLTNLAAHVSGLAGKAYSAKEKERAERLMQLSDDLTAIEARVRGEM